MVAGVKGVAALQHELEKAKENLKDVDENIKKLTGREPGPNSFRGGQGRGGPGGRPGLVRRVVRGDRESFGERERPFGVFRRGLEDAGIPPAKRQATRGAFSRLGPRVIQSRLQPRQGQDSGDEEELPSRPAVQSSVVVTPKDTVSRKEALDQQNQDEKGKARNRRMFGALLGTLQSFKKEESQKDVKVKQRKAIEEKLEEKAKEEKEVLKRERQTLFNERRSHQQKLRRLEQKMELVDIHEEWESQTKKLMNFIRTKAKPPLFYNPRRHNSKTDAKLKESRTVLEEIITDRRKQLEEEIEELTQNDDRDGGMGEDVDMDASFKQDREEDEHDPEMEVDPEDAHQVKESETKNDEDEDETDKKERDGKRRQSAGSVDRDKDRDRGKGKERDRNRDVDKDRARDKDRSSDKDRRKDKDRERGKDRDGGKHRERRDSDRDRRPRKDSERDDKGRSSRRHHKDSESKGDKKDKDRHNDGEEKENEGGKDKPDEVGNGENVGEGAQEDSKMADDVRTVDKSNEEGEKESTNKTVEESGGQGKDGEIVEGEGSDKPGSDRKLEDSQMEGSEASPANNGDVPEADMSVEY